MDGEPVLGSRVLQPAAALALQGRTPTVFRCLVTGRVLPCDGDRVATM